MGLHGNHLRVFVHCNDIAKVNSWLLGKRYAEKLKIPKRRQMALCKIEHLNTRIE